jgi:hypothetical protein
VRVLLNNGSGGFGTGATYAGSSPTRQVVLADVNNDGFLDVVAASNITPLGGVVLLNNHDGTLNQQPNLPVGTSCAGVGVLDFDNDGFADVILSASNGSGGDRFRGLGNGSFQHSGPAFGPAGGAGMTLADLNSDGLPDVVMPAGGGSPVIYVEVNAGGGVFNAAPNVPEPNIGTAFNVAVADVNGDGIPDLLVPLQASNALAVHPGLGGAAFGAGVTYSVGGGPTAVAVGDLNGDGVPDAVVTNGNGSSISVLLGIPLPVITTQPSPLTLSRGQTAVFSVAATGGTSFTWRVNGTPLVNGGHFSGVNTGTLTIIECTTVEAGSYDCVVGVGPGCQITSNAAALTVNNCGLPDFNGDGDIGTDADIAAFFRVIAGGHC